jgi:hypothetical protein
VGDAGASVHTTLWRWTGVCDILPTRRWVFRIKTGTESRGGHGMPAVFCFYLAHLPDSQWLVGIAGLPLSPGPPGWIIIFRAPVEFVCAKPLAIRIHL